MGVEGGEQLAPAPAPLPLASSSAPSVAAGIPPLPECVPVFPDIVWFG